MDLADLKPSTQAPIDMETLRGLPLGGIYVDDGGPFRLLRWSTREALVRYFCVGQPEWLQPRVLEIRYPKLPRLCFALTVDAISTPGDQPSGRCKSVTRRGTRPRWAEPGKLFLAMNGSSRSPSRFECPDCGSRSTEKLHAESEMYCRPWRGCLECATQRPRSDFRDHICGVGVFRILGVEEWGRWWCPDCHESEMDIKTRAGADVLTVTCGLCGRHWPAHSADTLTPRELELEGFPGADPDEFWAMLETGGQVRDGRTWRIEFEGV